MGDFLGDLVRGINDHVVEPFTDAVFDTKNVDHTRRERERASESRAEREAEEEERRRRDD